MAAKATQIDVKIGERVKLTRTMKGVGMSELAEKVGLSKGAISQFENGIIGFTAQNIGAIAKALGVSTDYLILGKEDKEKAGIVSVIIEKLFTETKFPQILAITDGREEIENLFSTLKAAVKR